LVGVAMARREKEGKNSLKRGHRPEPLLSLDTGVTVGESQIGGRTESDSTLPKSVA